MTPADPTHQLRNDLDGLYETVGAVQATVDDHTRSFEQVHRTLDDHGSKLDEILAILRAS